MGDSSLPFGFCECGCGLKTAIATQNHRKHGWVKGRPLRFVRGHSGRKKGPLYVEEDRGYYTPCWVWQRARDSWGYGHITVETAAAKTTVKAHRLIYERRCGPIPEGLVPDHLCQIPACVNPEHLELVTGAVNTQRGKTAKLNRKTVAEIRELHGIPGWNYSSLGRRYGVSHNTVRAVVLGQSWRD